MLAICAAARFFFAGQAIFPQEYFVYFKGKWRGTAEKRLPSGRIGSVLICSQKKGSGANASFTPL